METMTNKHLRIYRTQKEKVENIVHMTEREKLSTFKNLNSACPHQSNQGNEKKKSQKNFEIGKEESKLSLFIEDNREKHSPFQTH
jgi:hypothetical protein